MRIPVTSTQRSLPSTWKCTHELSFLQLRYLSFLFFALSLVPGPPCFIVDFVYSCSTLVLLLVYYSVTALRQFNTNPPQFYQHGRLPGVRKVQTCFRFNIAIVIHLKLYKLGHVPVGISVIVYVQIHLRNYAFTILIAPLVSQISTQKVGKKTLLRRQNWYFRWQ